MGLWRVSSVNEVQRQAPAYFLSGDLSIGLRELLVRHIYYGDRPVCQMYTWTVKYNEQ